MPKLHELLAVEKDKKNVFAKILVEARKLMDDSSNFVESAKTYQAYEEGDKDIPDQEYKAMVTTVPNKLDYVKGAIANYLDVLLQKEATNQEAKADIVVYDADGNAEETIATGIPVSALLQFEKHLAEIRNLVYSRIPTIDTNANWKEGEHEFGKVWVKENEVTTRTIQVIEHDTIDVGDKFLKKVIEKPVRKTVGTFTKTMKSGALSPSQKSQMLSRIDKLIEAVKKARAKANATDIVKVNAGLKIMNYING